ncbi:MAG: type VI secretion system tube protein TssD [Myxococcota bacterium]
MAMTVALTLRIDAEEIEVAGESREIDMDREETIECLSFVSSAHTHGQGTRPGFSLHDDAQFDPIRITKRIDSATSYIAKAFFRHEQVSGTFRFFRPSAEGDGTTEHFFTMQFGNAHIVEHEINSPNALSPTQANEPPIEKVGIGWRSISYNYERGNLEANLILG